MVIEIKGITKCAECPFCPDPEPEDRCGSVCSCLLLKHMGESNYSMYPSNKCGTLLPLLGENNDCPLVGDEVHVSAVDVIPKCTKCGDEDDRPGWCPKG